MSSHTGLPKRPLLRTSTLLAFPHFLSAPSPYPLLTPDRMNSEPSIQPSSRDISLGSLCRLTDELIIEGVLMLLAAKVRHLAAPRRRTSPCYVPDS